MLVAFVFALASISIQYQILSGPQNFKPTLKFFTQSLALAELSIALAMVFTRFDFELYETDISDVKLAHDYFIPFPKQDSKGIRVKVKLCPK